MKKIERILVSVYDKTGVLDFVKTLVKEYRVEVLSTGGTAKLLEKNDIKVTKISDYTESPEMFDGRVKTLHPKVEGGILYRRSLQKDVEDAEKYDVPPIDMVVCNLYQFKEAIEKPGITLEEALEMIDIGGPTMIRAAAKNFPDVIVVPGPEYYDEILQEMRKNKGAITEKTRATLAQQVFTIMADYNLAIANFLQQYYNPGLKMGDQIIKVFQKVQDCRYGENWDQDAAYYKDVSAKYGLHNMKQLGGKEISFNNYLDIDSCMQMLLDFGKEHHVTAILKHTSPNGIALDKKSQLTSVRKAFSCDPLSAFGGIWGVNKELTEEVADFIVNKEKIFIEVIMAPSFEETALKILQTKGNMRILEFGDLLDKKDEIYKNLEFRSTLGGAVVQVYDYKPIIKEWNVVSKRQVSEEEKEALIFAYRVSKWAKSNSACFAQIYEDGYYTIGIGAGQQSRVHVVKLAIQKAIEFGHKEELKNSVMGTDSFFPFPDGLEAAVNHGAKAILNPGGSIKDDIVIQRADELGCALVFCGKRVFRH
ncbi:MAG: bifunctional phosphoribosylaminoimidazolecarboxamide formyltransferase/IMP cyclohydrolase [Candidatus Lokiarchaeota archaeon]|nr:bifunctional phosphoribosylaminoimidazolecarboxamide formyltransferase/IMP cyclohydrolase [Candidatus Lokiarchaeota archaeon]